MHPPVVMLMMLTATAILVGLLNVPLMLRKVKPNRMYGLRTKETLENEAVWYEANEWGARLAVFCIPATIGVMALGLFLPFGEEPKVAYQICVFMVGLIVPAIIGGEKAKKIAARIEKKGR